MKKSNRIIGNVVFEVMAIEGKTAFIQIVEVSSETDVQLCNRTFQVPLWHNIATVGVDKTGRQFEGFEYRLLGYQIGLEKGDRLNALINHSEDRQMFFIITVAEEQHMLVANRFVQEWKAHRKSNERGRMEGKDKKTSQLPQDEGLVDLEMAFRAAEGEKFALTPRQQRMMKDQRTRKSAKTSLSEPAAA